MSSETPVILSFEGVSKVYSRNIDHARMNTLVRILLRPFSRLPHPRKSEFVALEDLTFSLRRGEKLAVLGPEGSGKTTVLRLAAGLSAPSDGRVRRRGSARIIQSKVTVDRPLMTLRLYVSTLLSFLGARWGEIGKTAEQVLDACALRDKADTRLRDLPAQDLKTVTLYASFCVPADLFLMDEISLGGFPEAERKALESSAAIFFASQPDQIPPGFDRVLVLHAKRCLLDGSLPEARECFARLPHLAPEGQGPAPSERESEEMPPTALDDVTPAPDIVPEPPRRKGTGLVRIRDIRLAGRAVTGQPLTIVFDYEAGSADTPLGRITLANLVLEDEEGRRVFGMPSDVVGKDFGERAPRRGTFHCHIPKLPLLPGRFGITIALLLDGVLADKSVNEAHLDVAEGDFFGTGKLPVRYSGPVCVPFSWDFTPGLSAPCETPRRETYTPDPPAPSAPPAP